MSGKGAKHERRERARERKRLADAAGEAVAGDQTPAPDDGTVPASHLANLQPADAPGAAVADPPTAPTRREETGTRRTEKKRKSRAPQVTSRTTREPEVKREPPPPPPAPVEKKTRSYADRATGTLASFVSATRRFLKNFTAPAPPEVRITLPKSGDMRLFHLAGELDERLALQAATWLIFVQAMKADADVVMTVDSPGGSITAGLSLIDVMLKATCRVRTHCPRQALGISSIVLAAGTKGYRTLARSALLSVPGSPMAGDGRTTSIASPRVVQAVASATGRTATQVEKEILKLRSLTPKLAVSHGLADAVAVS
ncbi:MAG: ATP-dependent Clp protease proteolytic subunit [Planctomycetes bacterium]|nr:ATP-dependent Clp protease proteolytic subunit [Planctomycetota bacterium]